MARFKGWGCYICHNWIKLGNPQFRTTKGNACENCYRPEEIKVNKYDYSEADE